MKTKNPITSIRQHSRRIALVLVITAMCAHGTAIAQGSSIDAKALLANPAHQAIFCGTDGGDASAAYSEAVAKAINTVIQRKVALDAASAIRFLKSQLCPPATK